MGCDIHLRLERCAHGVDDATKAARHILLMIAKRATTQREEEPQSAFLCMPSELWERCAKLVPVTGVDNWLSCDFAEWVYSDEKSFVKTRSEFEERLEEEKEEQRSRLLEAYYSDNGPFEDEDDKQDFLCEYAYEINDMALGKVMEWSASGPWSVDIRSLSGRHYNRFGLFGNVHRSNPDVNIQQLGCVRLGWPIDVNEQDAEDVTDPNLHSHCCVTLAGLFAVDWDVAVSSTARSGRALRPTGPFVGTPYQNAKKNTMRMLEDHPDLSSCTSRIFADENGAVYPLGWADMSEKEKHKAMLERLMEKMVESGDVPADDDDDDGGDVEEVETADAGSSADGGTTRHEVMGDDLCAGLVKMKARMAESGASPDDFRVLICYDN